MGGALRDAVNSVYATSQRIASRELIFFVEQTSGQDLNYINAQLSRLRELGVRSKFVIKADASSSLLRLLRDGRSLHDVIALQNDNEISKAVTLMSPSKALPGTSFYVCKRRHNFEGLLLSI